jgi:hypothetical protein
MKNKLFLNNKKRIFLKTTNKSIIYLASVLNNIRYLIKQIYHVWGRGYLRKIPVLRLNFTCLTAREIFRFSTGIFSQLPLWNMIYLFINKIVKNSKKWINAIWNALTIYPINTSGIRRWIKNKSCKLLYIYINQNNR